MKLKLVIVLFLFTLIISACNKEKLIDPNEEALCENMLYFDSFEEMNTELEKVMKMNHKERLAWEKSKGFTSIELEAERLYETIDPEQFKSLNEVKNFVKNNSHLLKLVEDDNGEYELETRHYDIAERYLLNNRRMYQIGDSIYNVFDNAKIVTSYNHLDVLKQMGDEFLLFDDKRFDIVEYLQDDIHKSTNTNCGNKHVWRPISGKEKLKVEIEVKRINSSKVACNFNARNYKKGTFGIWYWSKRSMKVDVDINFKYMANISNPSSQSSTSGWKYGSLTHNDGYVDARSMSASTELSGVLIIDHGDIYPVFTSYSVWADNKKAPTINQSCY